LSPHSIEELNSFSLLLGVLWVVFSFSFSLRRYRRELQKIGVIYVKRGQEDQNTILRNDKASRSPLFTEFIHALGWTVPLANHLGYTGGLDRLNRTTGSTTPHSHTHTHHAMPCHAACVLSC
jgi:hypothetical protein